MRGRARAAVFLLAAVAGCAPPARDGSPLSRDPEEAKRTLSLLRARIEAIRSFACEGTMLYQGQGEKHFIHYRAIYRRPDRLRVDLDVDGPFGIGGGRLSVVIRGDSLEALLPEEEEARRGRIGDPAFAFLGGLGLGGRDAPSILAPFAGDPRLFAPERLASSGRDARTGAIRLVLRRDDGNREVLLADPADGRLLERRIARPGGEVLLVCLYRGSRGARDPFPKETECRVPAEETLLRTRYGATRAGGPDPPDTLFRAGAPLP